MAETSGRIILLDDHKFRAAGVAALLSDETFGLTVDVTQVVLDDLVKSTEESVALAKDVLACVFVVGRPSFKEPAFRHAVECCKALLGERPLILLVDEMEEQDLRQAVDLDISGIVPTEMASDVAVAAIRFILAGGKYFPYSASLKHNGSSLSRGDNLEFAEDGPGQWDGDKNTDVQASRNAAGVLEIRVNGRNVCLTPRQNDVLLSLEKGMTNKEIGRELDLSESTVKVHVRHLMQKFGVTNRTRIALLVSSARHSQHDP